MTKVVCSRYVRSSRVQKGDIVVVDDQPILVERNIHTQPGIPPSPSQLVKVINEVTANKIKVIISSPYFTTSSSDVVAKQTGVKELTLATSVAAFSSIKNYYDLFDYNIDQLTAVLK